MITIKAQLRRADVYSKQPVDYPDSHLSYIGLALYPDQHLCILEGQELHVTPTEFAILEILLKNPGRPVNADTLFQTIWKEEYFDKDNNTITVYIFVRHSTPGQRTNTCCGHSFVRHHTFGQRIYSCSSMDFVRLYCSINRTRICTLIGFVRRPDPAGGRNNRNRDNCLYSLHSECAAFLISGIQRCFLLTQAL